MPAADAVGLRQAALALHALSPADRQRVLSRLASPEREVLKPLLAELSSLGIPTGRQWLTDDHRLAQGERAGAVERPLSIEERHRQVVNVCSWPLALQLLSAQGEATAAAVLRAASWPWHRQVVANWPPERKHLLLAKLECVQQVPAHLQAALLSRMASAVVASTGVPVVVGLSTPEHPRPWYRRAFSALF